MTRTDDPHPLIRRLRAMGMPDDVIIGRLVLEGWAEEDVAHAFEGRREAATRPVRSELIEYEPAPPPSPARLPRIDPPPAIRKPSRLFGFFTRLSPLFFGVVAVAVGLAATVLILSARPPTVYSISIPSDNSAAAALSQLSYGALPALSDPNYYGNVKESLIAQKTSFIDANLTSMQLTLYIDGALKLSVPILAKGEPGSWWETPAGIYKIQTKEEMHFSTFGQVEMPYSLDFQGNFFIHGWPTYPDGTPVASTYSGGCIRLSTDDAEKVYDLAQVGMPVVVYNEEAPAAPFNYTLKAPPSVSAQEYLVADLDSGEVLTERDASTAAPIASITKLVTALVATEYINLDKDITVPASAIVYTSVPRLKAGESARAYDLLFLLLQESSNEAAETLASAVGRDQFIADMNAKAKAIGLTQTTFADPSGAKDDFSTAQDLFTLLKYIDENRSFVFELTTGELTDSAYGKPAFSSINDFNIIKGLSSATLIGGKVGETNQAGDTYAGVFDVKVGSTDRHIAVIVLGSQNSPADVTKLLNFVHSSYAPAQLSPSPHLQH